MVKLPGFYPEEVWARTNGMGFEAPDTCKGEGGPRMLRVVDLLPLASPTTFRLEDGRGGSGSCDCLRMWARSLRVHGTCGSLPVPVSISYI